MANLLQSKMRHSLATTDIRSFLLVLCAILAPQRVLLSPIDAYICLVPLLISFTYYYDKQKYHSLLIISLFISVDNGAGDFAETAAIIRYVIYLAVFFSLINGMRFDKNKLIFALCLLLIPILLMVFDLDRLNIPILFRDITLSLLAILVLCRNKKTLELFSMDLKLLILFLMIYLFSELVNVAFFWEGYNSGYASYDSTKSLIVLPSLYYLRKNNIIMTLILLPITMFVLYGYVTRMLILVYLGIVIFYFASRAVKLGKKEIIFLMAIMVISVVAYENIASLDHIKLVGTFINISSGMSIEEMARIVDAGRTEEFKIIANQNVFNMMLGNGFGTGYYDAFGSFRFVLDDGQSFTQEELQTNYYFNFHDVWTDIAFRFGLLPVLLVIVIMLKSVLSSFVNTSIMAMTMFVVVFCAFFSTGGLLLIAMLALSLRAFTASNGGS